jgi:protein-disulfide isomerase
MNPRLKGSFDVLSTVLVCVAAAFVLWAQVEARWLKTSSSQQVQDIEELGLTLDATALRHVRGDSSVVFIEFTDYECPFCGQHARDVGPVLRDEMVGSKLLRQAIFNFPLEQMHPRARPAAIAAACAGQQGRFWEMHSRLFTEGQRLSDADLSDAARSIGIDGELFARCVESDDGRQLATDIAEAQRLGVSATPTFFVGRMSRDGSLVSLTRRISGALPLDDLRQALVSAAGERRQSLFQRVWRQRWRAPRQSRVAPTFPFENRREARHQGQHRSPCAAGVPGWGGRAQAGQRTRTPLVGDFLASTTAHWSRHGFVWRRLGATVLEVAGLARTRTSASCRSWPRPKGRGAGRGRFQRRITEIASTTPSPNW